QVRIAIALKIRIGHLVEASDSFGIMVLQNTRRRIQSGHDRQAGPGCRYGKDVEVRPIMLEAHDRLPDIAGIKLTLLDRILSFFVEWNCDVKDDCRTPCAKALARGGGAH